MAEKLVNCKVCGKEVASKANKCPHCGAKTPQFKKMMIGIAIAIVLFSIGQCVNVYVESLDRSDTIRMMGGSR